MTIIEKGKGHKLLGTNYLTLNLAKKIKLQ
jgi:hypothetical protein